jgi:hypothetical protein
MRCNAFNRNNFMHHFEHLRLPLRILGVSLLVFAALRAVFAWQHWAYFEPMGLSGLAQAFVLGLRLICLEGVLQPSEAKKKR